MNDISGIEQMAISAEALRVEIPSPKHSPAPWATFAQSVFSDSHGYLCALIENDRVCAETAYFNARLIAAAPDLLDMLIRVIEFADDGKKIDPSGNLMDDARAVVVRALSAV